MSNTQDPINWDHDDPIRTAAAQLAASAANSADRALQTAYMIQVMRTQRVQDELAGYQGPAPDQRYTPPADEQHGRWLNESVVNGDLVIHGPDSRVAEVAGIEPDGTLTVIHRTVVDDGDYQVIRRPDQPNYHQTTTPVAAAPGTTPAHDQAVKAGDHVKAGDRGNIGLVLSVDEDTALVRFTNKQTSATKDVPLPLTTLERTDPKQPHTKASGLLRTSGQPDPERLKHTQAKGQTKPNRPGGAWKQQQQPKRRPPKPPKAT